MALAMALVLASAQPRPAASAEAGGDEPVADTVIGAYAAVGCGLFGRALAAGFVVPGVIAGALATCGLMLFEALGHDAK